jgi:micrococcal nuclease
MKLAALILALAVAAAPAEPPREYRQRVVHISDGDTFDVDIMVMGQPTRVRLLRIDTPEKGRFAHCPEEDAAGRAATAYLSELIASGNSIVWLRGGRRDLYNRPLVEAEISVRRRRINLSDAMISAGHALPYGGGKKADWCARLRPPANDN